MGAMPSSFGQPVSLRRVVGRRSERVVFAAKGGRRRTQGSWASVCKLIIVNSLGFKVGQLGTALVAAKPDLARLCGVLHTSCGVAILGSGERTKRRTASHASRREFSAPSTREPERRKILLDNLPSPGGSPDGDVWSMAGAESSFCMLMAGLEQFVEVFPIGANTERKKRGHLR